LAKNARRSVIAQMELIAILMMENATARKDIEEINVKAFVHPTDMEKVAQRSVDARMEENAITSLENAIVHQDSRDHCKAAHGFATKPDLIKFISISGALRNAKAEKAAMNVKLHVAVKTEAFVMKTRSSANVHQAGSVTSVPTGASRDDSALTALKLVNASTEQIAITSVVSLCFIFQNVLNFFHTNLILRKLKMTKCAIQEPFLSGYIRSCFGRTYTKIGTIQRRLAWPLRKDDTQNREAFHIFC
jgi:hypothetical protein